MTLTRLTSCGAAALLAVTVLAATLAAGQADAQRRTAMVPQTMEQVTLTFAPVVDQVAPAVVNVYAERRVQQRGMTSLFDDPFFRRFFGGRGFGMPRERVQNSLGSGVIVRPDGIVVTNNHVIRGGEAFTVVLSDRREFDAEVLLADEKTDLAILKIDTGRDRLPAVRFKDSDDIAVGDLVLALGNPFGVGQTVTSGIISALARTQVGITDYGFFIQTDAAINPGNSGGALVASDGGLIGINTAIFSRSGGSNGIGFAIPSNMVRLVVDSAVAGEKLVRPWLGARYQDVDTELAASLGRDRPGGALITEVYKGGPADRAGLRSGDLLLTIESFDVVDPQSLRYRVATQRPGQRVQVSYWRRDRERSATIRVEAPPEAPKRNETLLESRSPLQGATVVNLSPAFNEENGLDPLDTGVAIIATQPRSLARQARFRTGDILLGINGRTVETVRDLTRILNAEPARWDIEFKRGTRKLRVQYGR
ncbi:MAG: Do family serine endopeptidase [Alphaproteobacteria bacterium]